MNQKLRYLILAADLLWIDAAFQAAQIIQSRPILGRAGSPQTLYAPAVFLAASIWTVLYFREKLEGFASARWFPTVFAQVTTAVIYLLGALLIFGLLTKNYDSRFELLYMGSLLPLGFIAIRSFAWWVVTTRPHGEARRRVVILGSSQLVRDLARKISRHPEMPIEVEGVLFPSDTEPSNRVSTLPAGSISIRTFSILGLMQKKGVQELIVVEPLPPGLESEKLISNCRRAGIRVHLVPQRYELYLSKAKLTEIEDVPLLSLEEQTLSTVGLKLKRIFDVLSSICLLVLSAPFLAVSAIALRSRKDKVLRKELRCGKNGRPFCMYRLNVDRWAPDLSGCEWILARFSMTELPQLWNVLKGDMSLVGPRPESPERVKHYSMWQRQRLSVTPGVTGLAQVNGLRENHSSEEKAHFDLQYIFHWSLFLDLSLLLQTIFTLVARLTEGDVPVAVRVGAPTGNPMFGIPKVLNADRTQSSAY
jgi:lipopolysaccharide/colanic/teichoic acid biosynthesis glycosyltransferase